MVIWAENPQQRMGFPEVILREQRNHCWIAWGDHGRTKMRIKRKIVALGSNLSKK
jgi:hypothetical protein